jgi:hypothetical protein
LIVTDDSDARTPDADDIPAHLQRWPGLFVRENGRIVEASAADQAVARGYPQWPDKGPLKEGRRITVMARKTAYASDEEIHVIHVYEVSVPDQQMYVMGPKPVYGEYLDGKLSTREPPPAEDPFAPTNYNGRVLVSPAVDYNYDITRYKLDPGRHQLYWSAGGLRSNTLEFDQA